MYKFLNPKEKRLKVYEGLGLSLAIASGTTLEGTRFDEPVCVISIRTSEKGKLPDLSNTNVLEQLNLVFEDIDTDRMRKSNLVDQNKIEKIENKRQLMAAEQADQILDFVERNKNHLIVCQCEAGISRSAGVASALSVIYNQTDEWIRKDPFFKENMYVRRLILNAYRKRLQNEM